MKNKSYNIKEIFIFILVGLWWGLLGCTDRNAPLAIALAPEGAVSAIPDTLVDHFGIDTTFFVKYLPLTNHGGKTLPILGRANVADEALFAVREICNTLLTNKKHDLLGALYQNRISLVIFGNNEYPDIFPFWNKNWDAKRYAGGYGPNAVGATCGFHEGDVLMNAWDRYPNENIVVHEFAHAIKNFALETVDTGFRQRVSTLWNEARLQGLWLNTYAGSNPEEYWAVGTQVYFDVARTNPNGADGIYNEIGTRSQLKEYDRKLYDLFYELYGDMSLDPKYK